VGKTMLILGVLVETMVKLPGGLNKAVCHSSVKQLPILVQI
jgi:hypothetical protein